MAARPNSRPPTAQSAQGNTRRVPVDLAASCWRPPVALTTTESKEELKRFCTETIRGEDCRPAKHERQATERMVRVGPVLEDLMQRGRC
jgi:hypothetical protein